MLVVNQLAGFNARGTGGGSALLYEIIQELGLNSGLVLCLDAADTRSYDGTSQTWTDIVAGNNFYRGSGSGSDAADPTFNGTAGLATEATYFSFDGGDYFTETAAHTFADDWHKDNGAFSLAAVYWLGSNVPTALFSNLTDSVFLDGIEFGMSGTLYVQHATSNTAAETLSGPSVTTGAWAFVGTTFNEASLACTIRQNASTSTPSVTASTATDANPQPLRLAAHGDALEPLPNTSRLACLAAWSVPIGASALGELYTLLKARRFTSMP